MFIWIISSRAICTRICLENYKKYNLPYSTNMNNKSKHYILGWLPNISICKQQTQNLPGFTNTETNSSSNTPKEPSTPIESSSTNHNSTKRKTTDPTAMALRKNPLNQNPKREAPITIHQRRAINRNYRQKIGKRNQLKISSNKSV